MVECYNNFSFAMREKKYRYSDWLNGKVVLNSQYLFDTTNKTIVVQWGNFGEGEQQKIRDKQKEIFDFETKRKKNIWIDDFKSRFIKSQMKNTLLKEELTYLYAWFSGNFIFDGEYYIPPISSPFNNPIEFADYKLMMYYRDHCLMKATLDPYDFIHSPNTSLREPNKDYPQITIHCVFVMINYLKKLQKKLAKELGNKDEQVNLNDQKSEFKTDQSVDNEGNLSFGDKDKPVFKTDEGYRFFLELKKKIKATGNKIINNSPSEETKYNLIWGTLNRTTPNVLQDNIKQKTFIDYIKRRHGAKIPEKVKAFSIQYNKTNKLIADEILKTFHSKPEKKNMSTNNTQY